MDGKLLILCDEKPGDYEGYSIKDSRFLSKEMIDPDDNPEKVFVCWDSVIPKDRSFIAKCEYYAKTLEKPEPDFFLSQKGSTDPRSGTIKTSIQEQSFLNTYNFNIQALKEMKQRGEDIRAEALELGVQFPFDAMAQFYKDFSRILIMNGIVRILPTYSNKTEQDVALFRKVVLEDWENENKFFSQNKSCAKVLEEMKYSNFAEVYERATDEMLKIYDLPIFGEKDDDEER